MSSPESAAEHPADSAPKHEENAQARRGLTRRDVSVAAEWAVPVIASAMSR
ncbi:hypothetical protein [Subtercola lobariae]|uniref:hypothetical protein n=1 Tax=Subtercola lobariae TaxID=1588641 RepID=UPI00166F2ED1|nr:hypothetical protein [Subtercola lobariae]